MQEEKKTSAPPSMIPRSQMNVANSMQSQTNFSQKAPSSNLLVNQLSKNNNVESMGKRSSSFLSQAVLGNGNEEYGIRGGFKENNPAPSFHAGGRKSFGVGNSMNSMNTMNTMNTTDRSMSRGKSQDFGGKGGRYTGISRAQTDDLGAHTLIKQLVGFSTGFTLKAKISKKSALRTYNKNGSEGHVFSIDLVDSSGEIQGSFFGEAAVENYDTLVEGRVYLFTGGTVKDANPRFQT